MSIVLGGYSLYFCRNAKILPPKNAATVCGSAAPYRQLQVMKSGKKMIWHRL